MCKDVTMLRFTFGWVVLTTVLCGFNYGNDNPWTIESHSIQLTAPSFSFLEEHLPPVVLSPEADATEWADFIAQSSEFVVSCLNEIGLSPPPGSLFAYDPDSAILAARLPKSFQADLAKIAEVQSQDFVVSLTLHIIEGPAAKVRDLVRRASDAPDHYPLFEEMAALTETEIGRFVQSNYLSTRSGNRVKLNTGKTIGFVESVSLSDQDFENRTFGSVDVGTKWELEAVLWAREQYIDVNFILDHHFDIPRRHEGTFLRTDSEPILASIVDTSRVNVTNCLTVRSGAAKLVGAWTPRKRNDDASHEVMQAAFILGKRVKNLPKQHEQLSLILSKHGERISKKPSPQLKEAHMQVRAFRVPPGFLKWENSSDPFADLGKSTDSSKYVGATAQEVLEDIGISFPKGAFAKYLHHSAVLLIRNTKENVDLTEMYTMACGPDSPSSIGFSLHVVEAPAESLRKFAESAHSTGDHSSMFSSLQKHEEFTFLETHWLEARSGQRCRVEAGEDFMFFSSGDPNSEGSPCLEAQIELVGTSWTLDPIISADGRSVEVGVEFSFDYSSPKRVNLPNSGQGALSVGVPSFSETRVEASLRLRTGTTRMLGMWQPTGLVSEREEVLQAAFLTVTIIRSNKAD